MIRYIPPEDFAKTTGMIFQNLFGGFPVFHFVGKVNKGFFGHIMLRIFRVDPKNLKDKRHGKSLKTLHNWPTEQKQKKKKTNNVLL